MLKSILVVLSMLACARAQIPSFGACPNYVPMTVFDMNKFLGTWYEAERYFQIFDPAAQCAIANYTKGSDGKYRVINEVSNRFTGIKRVLDGEIKPPSTKTEESIIHVKYTSVPLTPETQHAVLHTDYDSYAVLWSCSSLGLVKTQNVWLMTRAPIADGPTMQKIYGVLDQFKISRNFFIKMNQENCGWPEPLTSVPKPSETPAADEPVQDEPAVEEQDTKKKADMRSAIVPDEELATDNKIVEPSKSEPEKTEEPQKNEEVNAASEKIEEKIDHVEKSAEPAKLPVSTVPEVILKAADQAKDIVKKTIEEVQKFQPVETIKETFEKPVEQIQAAFEKPVEKIQEAFEKPIEQIKETFQKPLDQIKEVLNIPASENKETLKENEADKPKETVSQEKEETSEKKVES